MVWGVFGDFQVELFFLDGHDRKWSEMSVPGIEGCWRGFLNGGCADFGEGLRVSRFRV